MMLCQYCGGSFQLHYIRPGKVDVGGGYYGPGLVFYCDDSMRTPPRFYHPSLPFELWGILGHKLTEGQRASLISIRHNVPV